jgi:CcmD family protein
MLGTYTVLSDGTVEMLTHADQPATGDRSTEFRAVEGGPETMNGSLLMVEAYAAVWLVLFAFIFVSWRRQARLDARIDELARALPSNRGPGR